MSNLHDIQNHISSVSMTRQITNAMNLLSTSHLRKDLLIVPALSEYLHEILEAMKKILSYTESVGIHHKFTEKDTKGIALYLIITGDKGLCGDYNSNIAHLAHEIKIKDPSCEIITYNHYGEEYLSRNHIKVDYSLNFSTIHLTEQQVRNLTMRLLEMYKTDYFNEIYVISTTYSSAERKPQCLKLLPLKEGDFIDTLDTEAPLDMVFAPSAKHIFSKIVPEFVMGVLFDLILQSSAAENASRMEAMKSATDNADEMINELSLRMNNERQLGITNEITEITASQL